MSIKSFKEYVAEADLAASVKKGNPADHKGGKKHAGGETAAVKQGSSKMNEDIAADYVAPADKDSEATDYEPRSQGEKEFKDMHKMTHTKHPVAGDHQFDGSRNEVRS